MHNNIETKPVEARARPEILRKNAIVPLRADPNWKPEPCGLSREELRKIVAEILG
jgi:hypothetical protein